MAGLLLRVLRWLTDSYFAEAVAGDLEERRRRLGRIAGWWTYWQGLLSVLVFAVPAYFALRDQASELRRTCRSLCRTPWYAASVAGVIALGMALATTVFAVVDGLLFKPLPYQAASELFVVQPRMEGLDPSVGSPGISGRDVDDWRTALPTVTFTAIRAGGSQSRAASGLQLTSAINSPGLLTTEVDAAFFDTIGIHPLIGGFQEQHFSSIDPASPLPVILTHAAWQRRFGGDSSVVGRRFVPNEGRQSAVEVVGVLPPGFVFPGRENVDALRPSVLSAADRANPRRRIYTQVIARVPAGAEPDAVRQRIEAAMGVTAAAFPPAPLGGWRATNRTRFSGSFDKATLVGLREYLRGPQQSVAEAVFAAAVLLVLLACVNASGLMLARGQYRDAELAVRRALGASGPQIAKLLLVESLSLSIVGAVIGLAAAFPLLNLTAQLLADSLYLLKTPTIDWRVAIFTVIAAVLSAVISAGWPIRQHLRRQVRRSGRSRFSHAVIVGEVAVGLALTLGGALLVGSLLRVWGEDVGFETTNVKVIGVRLAADPASGGADVLAQALERIRAHPGVVEAGVTDAILLQQSSHGNVLSQMPPQGVQLFIDTHGVTSGFFEVLRPRLVEGRYPTSQELDGPGRVVVVGERMARAYWPNQAAVGQTVLAAGNQPFTVVGVVSDGRYGSWDTAARDVIYGPYRSFAMGSQPNIVLKTSTESASALDDVLQIIAGAQGVRAVRLDAAEDLLAESIRPRRLYAFLFGGFACAALLIVGVGVFGLLAMTTGRRVREIGIRMTLGAAPIAVVRTLVREHLLASTIGLIAGGIASAWWIRVLQSYTYQTPVYDVRAWAAAVAAISLVVLLGTLVPSVRASHIDPVKALRVD